MYEKFFKRFLDFWLSLIALIVLSPLLLILTITGAIAMKGNPFFIQKRPGRIDQKTGKEKIFSLIKFRTMSNKKNQKGKLLPDAERLNVYGRVLRKSSLDELPELINILFGQLSFVGPRPLAIKYLEYYSVNERHRHDVRPGLTGLAQVNGRNSINWPERFEYDLKYVNNLSFSLDVSIILKTFYVVFSSKDIVVRGTTDVLDFDVYRKAELSKIANENDGNHGLFAKK